MRRAPPTPPEGVELQKVADGVSYVGSQEHKSYLSPAGAPRMRADASKCDPRLGTMEEFTGWLKAGIVAGQCGAPWDGAYPRYVWWRPERNGPCYEGRLVNRAQGQYKGYPLEAAEEPRDL